MGDLEEDVRFFEGVDLPGHTEDAVLLMGPHPGRRQVKVLLLKMLRILKARRRVKQWWTVKDLNAALLHDLAKLSVESCPVQLLRHKLFLDLAFLRRREKRYLDSVYATFDRI